MKKHKVTPRLWGRLMLALAPLLGVSVPTSAAPAELFDADMPRRAWPAISATSDLAATPAAAVDPATPLPSPIGAEGVMSANPLWAIPLTRLSGTRERPIFSPSRRPPALAVTSVPAPKELPRPPSPPPSVELKLLLIGTISGGDLSAGIFFDQTSKTTLRLKIGQDYRGWWLRSVRVREVTMTRGELSNVLALRQPGEGGAVVGTTLAESSVKRGSSHTAQYD